MRRSKETRKEEGLGSFGKHQKKVRKKKDSGKETEEIGRKKRSVYDFY